MEQVQLVGGWLIVLITNTTADGGYLAPLFTYVKQLYHVPLLNTVMNTGLCKIALVI